MTSRRCASSTRTSSSSTSTNRRSRRWASRSASDAAAIRRAKSWRSAENKERGSRFLRTEYGVPGTEYSVRDYLAPRQRILDGDVRSLAPGPQEQGAAQETGWHSPGGPEPRPLSFRGQAGGAGGRVPPSTHALESRGGRRREVALPLPRLDVRRRGAGRKSRHAET